MAAKNTPKKPPTPTAEPVAEPEELYSFRVLVADIKDDKHPQVRVLELRAPSYESACEIVHELDEPLRPDKPGIAVLDCRLEEALPYLRQGFALRRGHWQITEILCRHPHVASRLDIYQRNPDHPHHRAQHLREAKITGADVMSEDWHVCARPPNFA